jgi:hypothetical protein
VIISSIFVLNNVKSKIKMKQKVSQKEWNDKRDAFLCATISTFEGVNKPNYDYGIYIANEITSELYEVEEIKEPRPMTEEVTNDN